MARGQPQTKPDELPWLEQALLARFSQLGHGIVPLPNPSIVRAEGDGDPAEACVAIHGGVRRCRIRSISIVVELLDDQPGTETATHEMTAA